MRLTYLAYRYADAVLDHRNFAEAKREVVEALSGLPTPLLDPKEPDPRKGGVKYRRRKPSKKGTSGDRYFFLPVNQKALNTLLDTRFRELGWELQPPIVTAGMGVGPETGLEGDFKKGRLQVEVQFGNMARWYTDVFKFQLSYALDQIDTAILVVATQRFANCIDENVVHFERVARELPWAKMSLTLPIWVIGIEPEDFAPVRAAYDEAFETLRAARQGDGIAKIPFEDRIAEEPTLDEESPD